MDRPSVRGHLRSIGACREARDDLGACATLPEAWEKCASLPRWKWWYLIRTRRLTAFVIARKLIASEHVDERSKTELRRVLRGDECSAGIYYWQLQDAITATRSKNLLDAANCVHDLILLQIPTRALELELQEWLDKDFAVLKSRRGAPPRV